MLFIPKIAVFVVSFTLLAQHLVAQQEWASFQNGGELNNSEWKLPTTWSPDSKFAWKVDLPGYGQSTPVVFEETVFVTSVTGENKETLNIQAINASDGENKWTFEHPNSSPEKNTVMVSRAAPTPVVDASGVIVFFEGGNLIALDHKGKLRWERDLKAEFGDLKARHGLAASLEQDDENIFLWAERMESPYIMAISKKDGKTVWKEPGLGKTSWSSPRLLTVGDETHLVLSAIGVIAGFDPANGKRRWEFHNVAGNSSSTPVPVGDGKFLMGSSGARGGTEYVPSCGVIQVKKDGDSYSVSWAWAAKKASCSFGSPFAHHGRVYFVNRTGIVHCHNLETGEKLFADRLPFDQMWATPLATGNSVYFFGKNGTTVIVEPADELKVLAENQLWPAEPEPDPQAENPADRFSGAVLYAASVADSKLILRRGDQIYAIEKE